MKDFAFKKAAETIRGGFATPYSVSGLPGKLSGCIYDAQGSKVLFSERFGGYMGDFLRSENPATVERPEFPKMMAGRGVYLGNYMGGHYGHFVTETLSTFWIFNQIPASSFDYFLFHPYIFGNGIPGYAKYCLNRFGIDESKIIFIGSSALALEEIVVPERLFRLNHSSDPALRWVYQHIAQEAEPPPARAHKLYLSRRRLNRRTFDRVVANEVEVEAEFRARGFEVLYPETMSFEEQLGRYHRATCLAGMSGSGLHNSVFMQPHQTVIELGDPRYEGEPAPTQVLCDGISGVTSLFIPFKGPRFGGRGTMLFDMNFLRGRLDAALGARPRGGPGRNALRATLDSFEVGYLALRPSIGLLARKILKHLGVGASRWREGSKRR